MEQISKHLYFETSKYTDLNTIAEKLESIGYIKELDKLLRKTFSNEANFTLQGKFFINISL